jgi:hypothetical protein
MESALLTKASDKRSGAFVFISGREVDELTR